MKVKNKITFTTELPFPMFVGKKRVVQKKTTLYFLEDSDGSLYTTELSPFPGISPDSLQSLEFQFEKALEKSEPTHHNSHVAFSLFELKFKKSWQQQYSPNQIEKNALLHYKEHHINDFKNSILGNFEEFIFRIFKLPGMNLIIAGYESHNYGSYKELFHLMWLRRI